MIESRVQILEARLAQVEQLLQEMRERLDERQATPINLKIVPFDPSSATFPLPE